jgi:hypothetical protein
MVSEYALMPKSENDFRSDSSRYCRGIEYFQSCKVIDLQIKNRLDWRKSAVANESLNGVESLDAA